MKVYKQWLLRKNKLLLNTKEINSASLYLYIWFEELIDKSKVSLNSFMEQE